MLALPHRPAAVQGKGKASERRLGGGKTAEKEGAEDDNPSRSHPKRRDPGKDKKPRGGSLFGPKKTLNMSGLHLRVYNFHVAASWLARCPYIRRLEGISILG